MAIKSNNTEGNPYHDEQTGEFTSGDKSTSTSGTPTTSTIKPKFKFKPGVNANSISAALQKIAQGKSDVPQQSTTSATSIAGTYRDASSIEEAIQIGREILPDCAVNYSPDIYLPKANELNKALYDVSTRFPLFCGNGLLNAYGDGVSMSEDDFRGIIRNSAINVLKKDKYFSEIFDKFFAESKAKFNLSDDDKFSDNVLNHFMRLDDQIYPHDFTHKSYGGGTLAFYQVSQDRRGYPGPGGKGINGAVKFFKNILMEPTQREIEQSEYEIKTGFHFDFGDKPYTYATGVHELGHSIFTIAYKKCNDAERQEIDRLLQDGRHRDYSQVSGYGHNTLYEQEAEAVADVMCRGENATPHNKKMVAWLDKVHKRLVSEGH